MRKEFIILLLVLFFAKANGQNSKSIPIQVSIFNENVQLPDYGWATWNPGVQMGTSFALNQSIRHQIGVQVYLGGFYHKRVSKQFYLGSQFFYRFQPGRFRAQLNLGSAFGRHQFPRDLHVPQNDGSFQTQKDKGRWQLLPTVGVQLGYQINDPNSEKPIVVFTQYDVMAQLQFIDPVPVLPHTLFHLGVEFRPF